MKTYEYQIIRYLPDRISGEFVNVGLLLFNAEDKILLGKVSQKTRRISSVFPKVQTKYIYSILKQIQKKIEFIQGRFNTEFQYLEYQNLDELSSHLFPKDNSALFFTEIKKGMDIDLLVAFNDLYQRFVLRNVEEDNPNFDDKEVWKKLYKKYFDKYEVTKHFKRHEIKTINDKISFEKSWKNDVWHLYETVSFDLTRTDNIKNKVYKWVGKLDELTTSKDKFNLYILAKMPTQRNTEIQKFINRKLGNINVNDNIIRLITEDEAETIAKEVKEEIEAHQ